MKTVYVITRSDIPLGRQFSQSCHSTAIMAANNPDFDHSNCRLIVLSVANYLELSDLSIICNNNNIKIHWFYEPDIDHNTNEEYGYTSFATDPISDENRYLFIFLTKINM